MENAELRSLKGVGVKLLEKLHKINIFSISDLVMHFPRNYHDKTKIKNISDIKLEDNVLVDARIIDVKVTRRPRSPSMVVTVEDDTGTIMLRWFKYYPRQEHIFGVG